jgi:phage-related protein
MLQLLIIICIQDPLIANYSTNRSKGMFNVILERDEISSDNPTISWNAKQSRKYLRSVIKLLTSILSSTVCIYFMRPSVDGKIGNIQPGFY